MFSKCCCSFSFIFSLHFVYLILKTLYDARDQTQGLTYVQQVPTTKGWPSTDLILFSFSHSICKCIQAHFILQCLMLKIMCFLFCLFCF